MKVYLTQDEPSGESDAVTSLDSGQALNGVEGTDLEFGGAIP